MNSIISGKKHFSGAGGKLFAAAFWLCVWQAVYLAVGQEILVVSPARVLERLAGLSGQADFWLTVFYTMLRILEGYLLGFLLGAAFAVLCAWSGICHMFLRPMISVIKATPVASFIILALVWMRSELVPVFATALIVLPIVWGNVIEGIQKTDESLLQMARVFRFSRLKTARCVYVPSLMPYLLAACTTGMGLAWKAGVAAEVLSSIPLSVGGQIYNAKIYLETADLYAWTAVVILLSVLLERLLLFIIRKAGENRGNYETADSERV